LLAYQAGREVVVQRFREGLERVEGAGRQQPAKGWLYISYTPFRNSTWKWMWDSGYCRSAEWASLRFDWTFRLQLFLRL